MHFPKIKFLEVKRAGRRLEVSLPLPLKIWAGRVASAATIALVNATLKGQIPHTAGEALSLVTGAVVAGTPVLQASGLLRAAAPGEPSVAQKAVTAVAGVVTAPAAQRRQKALDLFNQAKADAEQAGKAAAQAEFSKLVAGLHTGQYQMTNKGLVPVDAAGSGIPNVAGTGEEVVAPHDDAPAVLQQSA